MNSVTTTHSPLSSSPEDIQQHILEFLRLPDLCRLQLVSKSEKSVVDVFRPLLHKKELRREGAELQEQIESHLKNVQAIFEESSDRNRETRAPDQKYGEILSLFNRFKAKSGRFLPELPSTRQDSFKLFFSIRHRAHHKVFNDRSYPTFVRHYEPRVGIKKDSFELLDLNSKALSSSFNGRISVRLYNLKIMNDFVKKSLEEIEKKPTTGSTQKV